MSHFTPHPYLGDLTAVEVNSRLAQLSNAIDALIARATFGASSVLSGTALAGQKNLAVIDGSNFAHGQSLYIGRPTGSYETGTVDTVAVNTITLVANLSNTYTAGTSVTATPDEVFEARAGYATMNARLLDLLKIRDPRNYGAAGDGSTDDSVAVQTVITKCEADGGALIATGVHAAANLLLTRDIQILGSHVPGTASHPMPTATSGFLRNADAPLFSMIGTNHVTDPRGRVEFRNLMIQDGANVSSASMLKAKYADSVVLHNVTFWQPDGQTTGGHYIDAEECWDWQLYNVQFTFYGNAAGTKHAVRIYNGTNAGANCNDWKFVGCRFQNGQPGCNGVYFDSSGAGNVNFYFWFTQCKFEDTHNVSGSHVKGDATRVFFNQCEFGGSGSRHVNQPTATLFGWEFSQCLFTREGVTATEQAYLAGTANSFNQCHFEGQGTIRTLNGGAASGQKVIPVSSTSGMSVGATVYIKKLDGSLSESVLIASVSAGVSVTATSNLANSYVSGDLLSTTAILQHVNLPAASGFGTVIESCYRPSSTTPLVNYDAPINTKIRHNRNFVTENGSTAQITSGNTSVVVTHGMGYTPRAYDITVTPASSLGSAAKSWFDTITATTFTIHVNADPTATVTFAWQCTRVRG